MYKNEVGIPPLAMINDLVCPAVCGVDSLLVNAYITAKTNGKRLQFGVKKCHQLHIGKANDLCPTLKVDNWELHKVDEVKTGVENLEDVLVGSHDLEKVDKEKYLGDIISVDGRNRKNINSRKGKAVGIIIQITSILQDICFGPFHMEVALMLRNSLFINSILVNSEAWYGLTDEEIVELEKEDEHLLRKFLGADSVEVNAFINTTIESKSCISTKLNVTKYTLGLKVMNAPA